jgi:hypothetical protein
MDAIETKQIGKYKIEVVQDEDPQSPDDWGNDDAFVVYDHGQFDVRRKGFEPRDIFDHIQKVKRGFYDGYYVFVLYAYIHSGVVLSVGSHNFPDARWDVSSTGFVLVKRQKGWTWRRKTAFKVAESITEDWNQFLSGGVYGYKVTDTETDTEVDSCWGFYGELEICMTEATGITESIIEKDKHGQLEFNMK